MCPNFHLIVWTGQVSQSIDYLYTLTQSSIQNTARRARWKCGHFVCFDEPKHWKWTSKFVVQSHLTSIYKPITYIRYSPEVWCGISYNVPHFRSDRESQHFSYTKCEGGGTFDILPSLVDMCPFGTPRIDFHIKWARGIVYIEFMNIPQKYFLGHIGTYIYRGLRTLRCQRYINFMSGV